MDELDQYAVRPIGVVRSTLRAPADAPNQAFEGAPDALLEIDPAFVDALHRVQPGDELILLTWLHLADRAVLQTHPTGDTNIPLTGVFRTRSPDRPNPIGSTASPSPHSRPRHTYVSERWRRSTAPRSSTSRSRCASRQRPEPATSQRSRSAKVERDALTRTSCPRLGAAPRSHGHQAAACCSAPSNVSKS